MILLKIGNICFASVFFIEEMFKIILFVAEYLFSY